MSDVKYRVVLKVSYYEAHFDFEKSEDACKFAELAVTHSVKSEDSDRTPFIGIRVIKEKNDEESDE